ncbi:MAG: hypothetical protein ACRC17_08205, partial [Culicoidibacterales bacterium]
MKKLKELNTRQNQFIVGALLCGVIIGGIIGNVSVSGALADAQETNKQLAEERTALADENTALSSEMETLTATNKELSTKVEQAAPFFAMSETEQQNQILKAEQEKEELERAKVEAEAQAKAEAEKQAAYSKTYYEGVYKVGSDIPAGEYQFTATSGTSGYWGIYADSNQSDIIA